MKLFGIWTMLVALIISGVAAYYSIIGLVAIFAAAMLPIIIMGAALEVGKLTTAIWLHTYWKKATWWMKSYLSFALIILMFITSMGIFGFLSKAHIEQTSASEETVAKITQYETEVGRLNGVIERAETSIKKYETTGTGADSNIQAQIDKEQARIDKAFERIQPAIAQQNKIIADSRANDNNRTKPYEDQLTNIQKEITRLEQTAREYEEKITKLKADEGVVAPLLKQIDGIEQEIIRVTNQLNSKEQAQIRAAQAIIGVTNDGLFGNNTRSALAKWVQGQRDLINNLQGEVSKARRGEKDTVNAERTRLAGVVKDIRERQIPALKERELTMLGKIDDVRATESPAIKTARDEIQRLRESAENSVKQSQDLIKRLQAQLADNSGDAEIQKLIDEQQVRIRNATKEIDVLTEKKYELQAEYRKLEAEVGPVKYIAEFVYGDKADSTMLEEAVRWVIVLLVIVFDPLAVVLVIAGLTLIESTRPRKKPEPVVEPEEEEEQQEEQQEEELAFMKDNEEENPEYNIEDPTDEFITSGYEPEEIVEEPVTEPVEDTEQDITEVIADGTLHEDAGGFYILDNLGEKNYVQNPEQIAANNARRAERAETKEQIEKTINRMKQEGRWPNAPTQSWDNNADVIREVMEKDNDGELATALEKADEATLQQVYKAILTDLTPKND